MIHALTTMEGFKELLLNPLFLFLAMMASQFLSIVKKWWTAKQGGSTIGFFEIFTYWPQLLTGFGMSVAAFVGLVSTDTLNFVSATSIGWIADSLTDLFASRRVKAITDAVPDGTDFNARK